MRPQNILIAGCGYVGAALCDALSRQGCHVWALRRSAAPLPPGVSPIIADLLDEASLTLSIPPNLDAVVYCASPPDASATAYEQLYLGGLQRVLRVVSATSSLQRVLFTSSTGVYPQSDGEWVDEASPTPCASSSPLSYLIAAERWLATCNLTTVTLRLAGIYGPSRDRLIRLARLGQGTCYDLPRFTNRIHRDDAAAALSHLLFLPSPSPLYIGADSDPADWSEVSRWLAHRLGAPPPPTVPLSQASQRQQRSNKRCSSALLQGSGFSFTYPSFREGYSAMIDASPM
jgi:nucleoside-diphosphate-sugar epimerase